MKLAVEHTLKLPLEENKGVITVFDLVDNKFIPREANAKELIEIVEGYKSKEEKDLLIVEQQLKIRELEFLTKNYEKSLIDIQGLLYCCGGPLNDNFKGYSKEQLSIFFKIASLSKVVEERKYPL